MVANMVNWQTFRPSPNMQIHPMRSLDPAPTYSVYLLGSADRAEVINRRALALEAYGFEVASTWHRPTDDHMITADAGDLQSAIDEVDMARAIVLSSDEHTAGQSQVDAFLLGYALNAGIDIVAVDGFTDPAIDAALPEAIRVPDWPSAIAALKLRRAIG